MGFTVDGFNQAKRDMAAAFNKALDDAERLRKAAVEAALETALKTSGAGAAVATAGFPDTPSGAGVSLPDASQAAVDSLGKPIGRAAV